LGGPEFPTTIAPKEKHTMTTPKHGFVKADPETYSETLAGKTQCTTLHPHHPETEADRPKGGIRHSLCFHVQILANENG